MRLSAAQTDEYQDKWWAIIEPILSELLTRKNDVYLNVQISSTFGAVMCNLGLVTMLEELLDGYDISIQDNWSVELPKYLIEQKNYDGNVIIDLAGNRNSVRLEHFCFVAKVASLFYARYIDTNFEPWAYFSRIDKFVDDLCGLEGSVAQIS